MWAKAAIFFFATIVRFARASCPAPGGNCDRAVSLSSQENNIASPCYPNNYPDRFSCQWNLTASNSSYYSQIVLTALDIEAWHDYVKFDGPANFIIFYNKTEDYVVITGYPNGSVAADMVTDDDVSFKGFNASVVGVSEDGLLDQYSGYRNESLVQVLESPMYLSRSQNAITTSLDAMFMNIPNSTDSPVAVWKDYAGLISNSTGITVFDISDIGFSINWTEIDGTKSYNLTLSDSHGLTRLEQQDLTSTNAVIGSLSSGSVYNVSVTAINKLGNSLTFSRTANTAVADPANLQASNITQTSMTLQWDGVNGALNYSVNVTDVLDSSSIVMSALRPLLQVENLSPGVSYLVQIQALFEVGTSSKISVNVLMIPDNVTLQVQNATITTTAITVFWTPVPGADNYTINVSDSTSTVTTLMTISSTANASTLNPGTTYTFGIIAINSAGESFMSSVDATTELIPESATVWAEDETYHSFKVRWTNITGAIRYNLSIVSTSGNEAFSKNVGNVAEYDVNNLPSGTEYVLKLFVFNGPDTFKLLQSNSSYQTNTQLVTDVEVISQGQSFLSLNWTHVAGAINYQVEVSGNGRHFAATPTGPTVVFDGLEYGITYNVSIYATYPVGNGPATSLLEPTVPGNVTNLNENVNATIADLTWTSARGAESYIVKISGESEQTMESLTNGAIFPVNPGTSYSVSVKAKNRAGMSAEYKKSFISGMDAPKDFEIVGVTKNQFTLQWNHSLPSWTPENYQYNCTPGSKTGSVSGNDNSVTVKNVEGNTTYNCWVTASTSEKISPKTYYKATTAERFCDNNPCLNNGLCIEEKEVCDCTETTYSGTTCEIDLIPNSATLWAQNETTTGFKVHWTSIARATRYNLSLISTSGSLAFSKDAGKADNYDVDELPSGTAFMLKLFVFIDSGKFEVLPSTDSYSTKTSRVPNVRVESPGQTHFTVAWNTVRGATSYKINVTGNGQHFAEESTGSSIVFNQLNHGIMYTISMSAVFPVGIGPVTMLNESTVPGNVTDIAADVKATTVNLTWPEARGATSYTIDVVYVSINSRETFNEKETSKLVAIQPGTDYSVSVKAKNKAGTSNAATASFQSDLDAPKNFEIVGITKNQFVLTWDHALLDHIPNQYRYNCTPGSHTDTVDGNVKSHTVVNLEASKTYNCEITALTLDAVGSKSVYSATTAQLFCEEEPCLNGGTCLEEKEKCACTAAYEGLTCEDVIDWCADTTCAPEHSYCINDVNILGAVCNCMEHFDGDPKVRCQAFCKQQDVSFKNRTLQFNYTFAGATAFSTEQCKEEGLSRSVASAVCRTKIGIDGQLVAGFENIVDVPCKLTISNVTIQINPDSTNVTSEVLETQSAQLQVLTSGRVVEEDVKKVARYMEDMASIAETNEDAVTEDVLIGLVNTADNLIQTKSIQLQTPPPQPVTQPPGQTTTPTPSPLQKEKEVKQKILKSLTTLAELVQIPNDTNEIVIETPSIVVKVIDLEIAVLPQPRAANLVVDEEEETEGRSQSIPFEPFVSQGDGDGGKDTNFTKPLSITIPGSAVDRAKDEGNALRISFFLHKDASLFPSATRYPPGMIIAASLGEGLILNNLQEDIEFRYTEIKRQPGVVKNKNKFKNDLVSYECAYWDFNLSDWSNEGCCLDPDNITMCRCNHLTNFALLVSDKPIPASVALEVMSSVGLILSIFCLLITIVIHCLKEEIRKRRPTQILMHICANLAISYLVFLLGVNSTSNERMCTFIAGVIQFFFLASWCWMSVYAYDMYRSFVLVFNTSKSRYMTKCTIFAYGVPLLIVLINATIALFHVDANKKPPGVCDSETGYSHLYDIMPVESSYVSSNMCLVQGNSLYFGFLLPIGLMLAFNLFVYANVLKTLSQRKKTVKSSAKKTGMKDNFMISITLSASTGLTWVIAYIMLLSSDETYLLVTSWIFAVFNVLQGVIIFITTCVRHENMRKIWLAPISGFFSRSSNRIRMLSPKSKGFDFPSTSGATASYLSTTDTSATKVTAVKSISAKEITTTETEF